MMITALLLCLFAVAANAEPLGASLTGGATRNVDWGVQGVVVDESQDPDETHYGGPSLIQVGTNLILSHSIWTDAGIYSNTILTSADTGTTWTHRAALSAIFHGALFATGSDIYLLGDVEQGSNIVIRKSTDMGATWTTPTDSTNGLLYEGAYTVGCPQGLIHSNRIFVTASAPTANWGEETLFVLSAATNSDLLAAASWTKSGTIAYNAAWGIYEGWLEGNPVVAPDSSGDVWVIARVHEPNTGGVAAVTVLSTDWTTYTFATNWITFPGGCKRFHVRSVGGVYYALSNAVLPPDNTYRIDQKRNRVALMSSTNLTSWTVLSYPLFNPHFSTVGYQYPSWISIGNDILCAMRTAHTGTNGAAPNHHDSNMITFHRFIGVLP